MERDDAGAFARLREIRERVIDPKIAEHGGRVVKTAGDGMLLEFASADAALRCAIDVQRAMSAANELKAPDERIEFRIGVNLGDIIVDGNDIAGDGVNVAARLEALAEPGGICVSAAVREQVHGSLDVSFVDVGEQQVKNISRPIRVFAVDLRVTTSSPVDSPPRVRSTGKVRFRVPPLSMAVFAALVLAAGLGWWAWQRDSSPRPLPLAVALMPLSTPDSSGESSSLADRVTKDLRVAMGRSIRDAPLVAASRTVAYAGNKVDPRTGTHDLHTRYLVGGDAQRNAGQVTVTLQLVDGETAAQLWSTQVSLPEAQTVGDASPLINRLSWRLRNAIRDAQVARAMAGRATDNEVSDLVSRANAAWGDDLPSAFKARKLFDAALQIDSNYVPALLGRAWTLNHEFEDDQSPTATESSRNGRLGATRNQRRSG